MTLTIRLDAGRVTTGDQIRLDVTATNTQNGLVMWQGGGCDLLGNIQLHGPDVPLAPIGDPPPGNDPAAIRGLVRWSALANSGGGLTGFVPPNLPPGQGFACTSDLRINELKPGATERVEAIWNGTTADGIPSPAGGYTVDVSFPYLSRQDAGPFEGDPFADAEPIVVGVPFEVVGEAWHGLTAAQAVDRALGDGRLITWLAEVDKTELGGASIRLQDGAAWRLEVTLSSPTGIAAVGRVDVDPVTGEVTRVDLPAS